MPLPSGPGKLGGGPPLPQTSEVGDPDYANKRLHIRDGTSGVTFLVDSGSEISILPRSHFKRQLQRQGLTLCAANLSPIATFGSHSLPLDLGLRRDFCWPFVIADVPSAIIGADFLHRTGLLVDVRNRRLVDPLTGLPSACFLRRAALHSVQAVLNLAPPGPFQGAYDDLLNEFKELTAPDGAAASLPGLPVRHCIQTTGPPVHERPRRLVGQRLLAAKQEIEQLLDQGIVRPSSSQWASPIHLVAKPSGGWRVTGDYRRLNAVTVPDRYPLPIVEDLLQEARGSVFSVVDLRKAFYQIAISEEDIPKTAVTTPFGLFEFTRSSLGQRNAAQSLQRTVDHLLRDLPFVRAYLDDFLIFSPDHETHLRHLRQLFQVLQNAGLRINPDKCLLGQPEVSFLGYSVTAAGFTPPPAKVQAIRDFPKPQLSSELRRYLGMVNYYRRCIPRAAALLAPLNDLLQGLPEKNKKVRLQWTPQADRAFARSKEALAAAATTTFLRPDAPLALRTDASATAIGASIEQEYPEGIWTPLGFFSRKLSATEQRYSTYDRELLAVFCAIKFFRRFLEGRSFVTFTDQRPLTFADIQPSDKASPRQARQLDYILQFCTSLQHVKGEDNAVADALSRIEAIAVPSRLNPATIATAQATDEELAHLLEDTNFNLQLADIEGRQVYVDLSLDHIRPYVPVSLRRVAFEVVHKLSHPSVRATAKAMAQKFYWPSMRRDTTLWAQQCLPCQKAKVQLHNRAALSAFDPPSARFDHVHMDIVRLPLAMGFQYCLTLIDRFSRWPVAIPIPDQQASTVAKAFVEGWIAHYGTPLTITTDQGAQFESALFSSLSSYVGTGRTRTAPYHPQSNGLVERFHRALKAALMCSPETPWPTALPLVLLGLRTAFKEDLQASPAEMLYGTTLRIPGEFFVTTSHPQAAPASFVQRLHDLTQAIKPVPASRHATNLKPFFHKDLRVCTHVFRRLDLIKRTLTPPYTGPFKVLRRIDDKRYVIDIGGTPSIVSTDSLKPAFVDTPEPGTPPAPSPTTQAATQPAPAAQPLQAARAALQPTQPVSPTQPPQTRQAPAQPSLTAQATMQPAQTAPTQPMKVATPATASGRRRKTVPAILRRATTTPPTAAPKRVSFLLPTARATRRGVVVAVPTTPPTRDRRTLGRQPIISAATQRGHLVVRAAK